MYTCAWSCFYDKAIACRVWWHAAPSVEPLPGWQRRHLSEAHDDADDNLSLLPILSHPYPVWEPLWKASSFKQISLLMLQIKGRTCSSNGNHQISIQGEIFKVIQFVEVFIMQLFHSWADYLSHKMSLQYQSHKGPLSYIHLYILQTNTWYLFFVFSGIEDQSNWTQKKDLGLIGRSTTRRHSAKTSAGYLPQSEWTFINAKHEEGLGQTAAHSEAATQSSPGDKMAEQCSPSLEACSR